MLSGFDPCLLLVLIPNIILPYMYMSVCCLVLVLIQNTAIMWRRPEPRHRRQESGAKLSQAVSVGRWHWAGAEGSDDWDVTWWAPAQWSVLLLTNKQIFCKTQLQVASLPPVRYVIKKRLKWRRGYIICI